MEVSRAQGKTKQELERPTKRIESASCVPKFHSREGWPMPRDHIGLSACPSLQCPWVWASLGALVRTASNDLLPIQQGWCTPAPLFNLHWGWPCLDSHLSPKVRAYMLHLWKWSPTLGTGWAEVEKNPPPYLCVSGANRPSSMCSLCWNRGEPPPHCSSEALGPERGIRKVGFHSFQLVLPIT